MASSKLDLAFESEPELTAADHITPKREVEDVDEGYESLVKVESLEDETPPSPTLRLSDGGKRKLEDDTLDSSTKKPKKSEEELDLPGSSQSSSSTLRHWRTSGPSTPSDCRHISSQATTSESRSGTGGERTSSATPARNPVNPFGSGDRSYFPLEEPPKCKRCQSPGTLMRVGPNKLWNPEGREYYSCFQAKICTAARNNKKTPGERFICWNDDIGIDETNTACKCGFPSQLGIISELSGEARKGYGFFSCMRGYVKGSCDYYSEDEQGVPIWRKGPLFPRRWKPKPFRDIYPSIDVQEEATQA